MIFPSHLSQFYLTPIQYGMCYREAKPDEVERHREFVNKLSTQKIVVGGPERDASGYLVLAHWAENKLMILRSKPIVVVTNAFGEEEEHSSLYSDLLLYRPWMGRTEIQNLGFSCRSLDECRRKHSVMKTAIEEIKEGLKKSMLDQM